jgi:hypothetical protein
MGPEKTAVKSCERCLRQAVCILYHGYSQLELRFGNPCPADPEQLMHNLSEALASKCGHYLQADSREQEG